MEQFEVLRTSWGCVVKKIGENFGVSIRRQEGHPRKITTLRYIDREGVEVDYLTDAFYADQCVWINKADNHMGWGVSIALFLKFEREIPMVVTPGLQREMLDFAIWLDEILAEGAAIPDTSGKTAEGTA